MKVRHVSRILRIQVEYPSKARSVDDTLKTYMMVGSTILLTVSEVLPFVADVQANGILDALCGCMRKHSSQTEALARPSAR